MYKFHKYAAAAVFAILFIFSYLLKINLTSNFVSNIITFLSVVFGFYFTGLSILFGSNFSKRLGRQEDSRRKVQTKLHTLRHYFIFSSFIWTILIIALLIYSIFESGNNKVISDLADKYVGQQLTLYSKRIFISTCLSLSSINIMFMWLLVRVFLNAFVEEGER